MARDIIRGKPNEPIALEPTLGWIISRPYSFINSTSVCNSNSHFLFVPLNNCRYAFEMKLIINCQRFGM